MVKGGQENKCVSKEWEEAHRRANTGKVCPRPATELSFALAPDVAILEFALNERMKHVLSLRAELVADEYAMTNEELNKTLSRVAATIANPKVSALLNPKAER